MKVPFADLTASYRETRRELDAAYEAVLSSGRFILGEQVAAFEREFARYCGAAHCVGVGNGLDALTLLLKAKGVGPGDEVIVPAHTFIATWLAVSAVGAVPCPVDVRLDTFNLDAERIAEAITARTKAILPVHLYGQPADMDAIQATAAKGGLLVIEDAAQAHGARYRGRMVGALGNGAGFSFYPIKNLGALGDGGAVVMADTDVAERVRRSGNYGSIRRYEHTELGTNSRLDELQAAFLRVNLRHLDGRNAKRREVAAQYLEGLRDLEPFIALPAVPGWADPVWHLFVIRCASRDRLAERLRSSGIDAMIHYAVPPHLQPAYRGLGIGPGTFPVAERIAVECLSLPIGPHLSAEQVGLVITALHEAVSAMKRVG